MRENELHELSSKAVALLKNDCTAAQEVGIDMLKDLACFRELPLPESVISTLLDLQIHWPAILFRGSGDEVASQLLYRIGESSSKLDVDHLLLCLAWNQSDFAKRAFVEWSKKPPSWSSILNLAAVEYAMYAGWAIDKNRIPTALIEKECYRLPISTTSPESAVSCRAETESKCPSCEGKLSRLFDFRNLTNDQSQKLFVGNRLNAPRVFQTCLHCSISGTVLDRFKDDQSFDRISPLAPCEYPNSGYQVDSNFRTLANETSSAYATAEPFMLDDATSVGGLPSWLQNACYPRCLCCDELMIFFGQHDNGSLSEEGIYYAFFCPACQISAVNYQQT